MSNKNTLAVRILDNLFKLRVSIPLSIYEALARIVINRRCPQDIESVVNYVNGLIETIQGSNKNSDIIESLRVDITTLASTRSLRPPKA